MAALCRPTQPNHGRSVPMTLTNQTLPQNQSDIVSRTPASMPEATLPCTPAGFDPNSNLEDMNNPSQINPLAHAGAGGAAGHDAAACVSACSECAGASVSDARDASELSSTTLPVVAPQTNNKKNKIYSADHLFAYPMCCGMGPAPCSG